MQPPTKRKRAIVFIATDGASPRAIIAGTAFHRARPIVATSSTARPRHDTHPVASHRIASHPIPSLPCMGCSPAAYKDARRRAGTSSDRVERIHAARSARGKSIAPRGGSGSRARSSTQVSSGSAAPRPRRRRNARKGARRARTKRTSERPALDQRAIGRLSESGTRSPPAAEASVAIGWAPHASPHGSHAYERRWPHPHQKAGSVLPTFRGPVQRGHEQERWHICTPPCFQSSRMMPARRSTSRSLRPTSAAISPSGAGMAALVASERRGSRCSLRCPTSAHRSTLQLAQRVAAPRPLRARARAPTYAASRTRTTASSSGRGIDTTAGGT